MRLRMALAVAAWLAIGAGAHAREAENADIPTVTPVGEGSAMTVIPVAPLPRAPEAQISPVETEVRRALTKEQKAQLEREQAKAIMAFNAKHYSEAETAFRQIFSTDPSNFLALEYLAKVAEAFGDFNAAIRIYQKAKKAAPKSRWGFLNFYIGDLYMRLKKEGSAETFLLAALKAGAYPLATNYYLGFIMMRQEQWRQAENYFHEAERLLETSTLSEADRQFAQPLHYYLGELYARTGFPRYSLYELYTGADGANQQVKRAAWVLEEALDRPSYRFSGGFFLQYDSNVLGVPEGSANPVGFSNKKGEAAVGLLDVAAQSSPSRKFGFGGEYVLYANRHTSDDLGQRDLFTNSPALWVSWWNSRNLELRLRYDYTATLMDRTAYKLYLQSHGPQAALSYFWDRRHQLDATYAYKSNYYPSDLPTGQDQRSGIEHVATFKGSFSAPNPDFQPYAQLTFDYNNATGRNFNAMSSGLEIGTGYWFSPSIRANASASYALVEYPNNPESRGDTTAQLRLNGTFPLSSSMVGTVDFTYVDNNSTLASVYSYQRFTITMGAVYTLPF